MNATRSAFRAVALASLAALATAVSGLCADPLQSRPLNPRSGTGQGMRFTAIPGAVSGLSVKNPYNDPAMWGDKFVEFKDGAIGSGLAAGDVDGDGWVDLFVANKVGPNQLFRQVDAFRFVDVTAESGVAGPPASAGAGWKTGATFADVDNDGDLDLYVCRFNAPNLLYLNDGRGRFTEAAKRAGVDLLSGSVVGAFADYDRDGHLDLFVLTNVLDAARRGAGEPDTLYRNRGDGTFVDVTASAGLGQEGGRGHSATWFDGNGDGWLDLYITNDFAVPDRFYRNNGDGTFVDFLEESVPYAAWSAMGSDFGDINNDGLFDLFVADMAATTHYKAKVAMGDMGGLVDHMDTLRTPQYMNNTMFVNTGADRFLQIARLAGMASSDWTWSPRFEDLDNDGWLDLHLTNGMVRNFINSDLLNQARQLQSQGEIIALMKGSPPLRETNLAWRNEGDFHFSKAHADWGLDQSGISFGSAFADFDQDGDLDLAFVNYEDNVTLLRNDCPSGQRSIVVALRGTESNRQGVGARVFAQTAQGRQSRALSVARGALSSSEPILHIGLDSAAEVESLEVHWPSGQVQRFTNLAADHRYLISEPAMPARLPPAIAHRRLDAGLFRDQAGSLGLDFVNRERVFNDMVRQSLLPNRMNTLGGGLAWGDVNGDDRPDLFFAGAAGVASALYLAGADGRFRPSSAPQPWTAQVETEAMAPVFFDLDRDGDLDLFVSSGSTEYDEGSDWYRSHLYLNDGSGRFAEAEPTRFSLPPFSAAVVAAADYDRDGDLDLFVGGRVVPGAYPTAPLSALLENRAGVLVDVTDHLVPELRRAGMVSAALWTDAEGDGWVDLAVTGEWMPVRLFRNGGGQAFAETTAASGLAAFSGWWNSLAAADVNGDGAMDLLAGNVGDNTKYHADPRHPVSVYYGDFEGSGHCEIVEAKYEGDRLYPVRGRSCSSLAMPSLKEKFRTFHDWGAALLPEIYPAEKLDQSLHLSVAELHSGVFLNDGRGEFSFRRFPAVAQLAPVFGLAASDFNGDGHVDVLAVQNFNGPQVETGRYNGGISVLLSGDGQGNFAPMTAPESGIVIAGEARGAALADFNQDGWPDVVVTRINEPVLALQNRGHPAARPFAIKLKGAAGNVAAIGARISVRCRDGSRQSAELHAGAGYLSQSQPLAFFVAVPGREPVEIEIRWPDGRSSRHRYVADATLLTLEQPPLR